MIYYDDLGLTSLILYYENKKDARSKMTADYLKEYLDASGLQMENARRRLTLMRQRPTRQHTAWLARHREEKRIAKARTV